MLSKVTRLSRVAGPRILHRSAFPPVSFRLFSVNSKHGKNLPYGDDFEANNDAKHSCDEEEQISHTSAVVMVVSSIVVPSSVYAGVHLMWNRSMKKRAEEKSEVTLSSRSPS